MENKNSLGQMLKNTVSKAKNAFQRIRSDRKKRTVFYVAAVVTGVLLVSLATLAVPPSVWFTLNSANCLTQGEGNTMAEAPGAGAESNRNFLYILFGGNTTSFKRLDPTTGNCEATTLATPSVSIRAGATISKLNDNTLVMYPGSTNNPTMFYFIEQNAWVFGPTAKFDETVNSDPILSYTGHDGRQYDGNAIASIGQEIFVSNGSGSCGGCANVFAKYNTVSNVWTDLSTGAPTFLAGTRFVPSGTDLYVIAGSNVFRKFDTLTGAWTTLPNTPATQGYGAAMTIVGNNVYVFRGGNFNDFWRYDITQDPGTGTWDTSLTRAPEPVRDGGYLEYPGSGEYIYAFQGNETKNFWRYCLPGSVGCTPDTWDTTSLTQPPAAIKSGSGLAWDGGDYFYATRGSNTKDFWRYCLPGASTCTQNTWEVMPSTPVGVGNSGTDWHRGGLTYACPAGPTCPGTGTIWMTSGNSDIRSGGNGINALFRFPLSGTNAGKWPVYYPGSLVTGVGASYAYPGPSAEDPTGDFLYSLWGNNTNGFMKYSLSRSEPIPWTRSFLDFTNPVTGLLDSTVLLNQPNFSSGNNYQQGPGTAAAEVNGKIYIINGNSTLFFSSYDPVTNVWEELPPSPSVFASSGASIVKKDNQNLYVSFGNNSQYFFRFYLPTKEWIQYTRGQTAGGIPIVQSAVSYSNANTITAHSGKFYIIGSSTFESYDPVTNTLTRLNNMTNLAQETVSPNRGTSLVSAGSYIYALPAASFSSHNPLFLRYDPATNLWTQMASMPQGNPIEINGPGGSLAYVASQNKIYAFKGNNSRHFFSYDIGANTWTPVSGAGALAPAPEGIGGGGSLVALGTDLFAFSGNNTRNFWRYDTTQAAPGSWVALTNPPPEGVSGGASLTTDGTNIYATKGNLTKTFWKYTITNTPNPGDGTWTQLADSPVRVGTNCGNANPCTDGRGAIVYFNNGGSDEIWMVPATALANTQSSSTSSDGGALFRYRIIDNTWPHFPKPSPMPAIINAHGILTYPGTGDFIYFLRGNSTADFWAYDTVNNTWNATIKGKFDDNTVISQNNPDNTALPANHSNGSSIVEINDELYVITGGGSVSAGISPFSFQKFTPATNTWTNLADIPSTNSSSGVGDGGALATRDSNGDTIPDTIYFFRGNSSQDFWRYDVPSNSWISFNIAKKDDGTPISQFSSIGSGQTQGSGNKIVELNGEFYVSTGNSTYQFEKYNPTTNTWTALPNPTFSGSSSTSFTITLGTGASMTKVGNQIYAIANTNSSTTQMQKYDPATNTWSFVVQMPTQAGTGAFIAYHGDVDTLNANSRDFIYYMRGSNTTSFYRYCLQNTGSGCTVGSFTTMTAAPANIGAGGSSTTMTVGGTPYIYVLGGYNSSVSQNTANFWRWNILNASNGAWDTLAGNQAPETVGAGGALTNDGTYIYATRGANSTSGASNGTKTFWKYDPVGVSGSRWTPLAQVPARMGTGTTTSGPGGLAYCATCGTGEIWAVTGNGRYGFRRDSFDTETGGLIFRYKIADNTWPMHERTPASPATISGGGALNYPGTGDYVYAFNGGFSTNFWNYDYVMNEWNAFAKSKLDTGKPLSQLEAAQGAGNSIVEANGKFYMLLGNSNRFFEFNPSANRWTELSTTPYSGSTAFNVGDGAAMVAVDNNGDSTKDDIYILRGAGQAATNFWKYNIALGAWTTLTQTPLAVSAGGSIAYPGTGDYLFAFRGGTVNTFWKYCFKSSGSTPDNATCAPAQVGFWSGGGTPAIATPTAAPATVGGGGSLVGLGGDIYALGGGATNNFWKYNVTTNIWESGGTDPADPTWTTGNIQSGGSLTTDGTDIYATRGSNSAEIRKYTIGTNTWTALPNLPANMGSLSTTQARGGLAYISSGPSGAGELFAVTGNGTVTTASGTPSIFRFPFTGTNANTWPLSEALTAAPNSVSAGGSLLGIDDRIYAFQGGGSTAFWFFDRVVNEWTNTLMTKSVIDTNNHPIAQYQSSNAASQSSGNTIVQALGEFYVLTGSSQRFHKYNPTTNRWTLLTDTPATVGNGAAMVPVDTDSSGSVDTIYVLAGNTTTTFWSYDIAANTWTTRAVAPATIGAGGALAYPGSGDYLYAFRGTNTTTFYKYCFRATISGTATTSQCSIDVPANQANSWSGTNGVTTPTVAPATVQGGGALVGLSGSVYALRGNNTNEFWIYDPTSNTWNGINPADPTWTSAGSVTAGGSLTTDGSEIYAFKGDGDPDMRRYVVVSNTWLPLSNFPETVSGIGAASGTTSARGGLAYIASGPSGGPEIFAVSGNGQNGSNPNSATFSRAVLYRYIIGTDTWPTIAPLAVAPATEYAGGSLTKYDNTTLYASRGSGTANIWRYNIPNNRWNNAADAPPGGPATPADAPVTIGNNSGTARGGLVYSPGLNELFMISGYGASGDGGGTDSNFVRSGLLFRHPFTGVNAHTWPFVGSLTRPPGNVNSTGAALTALDNNTLFAFQGGSTAFWRYNIPNNRWNDVADGGTPTALPQTTGSGASLTSDLGGTNVWASRGNNTAEMYRYDASLNTWTPQVGGLANAPFSFGVSSNGGGILYANNDLWGFSGRGYTNYTDTPSTVGGATAFLYRYDIASNTWPGILEAADAPTSPSFVSFYGGSSLAATPDGLKVFALRGSSSPTAANPNMWLYSVSGTTKGTWTALPNMPNNTAPFNIFSGGSLVAIDDTTLFATRGATNTDFYRFDYNAGTPASSTWLAKGPVPLAPGTNSSSDDRGELVFSPQYGSMYFTPGTDTVDPFNLYSYPVIRTVVTCVTAAADAAETNARCTTGAVTPTVGQPIGVIVQTVDQNDVPVNVAADTDVALSVKSGSGTLSGTTTGTITTGNSSTVIVGFTYSVPDGAVILSASDVTSPPNLSTFATSDSDPFTVNPALPAATSIVTNPVSTPTSGPTGGRTGVLISGTNFYTHYQKPIAINSASALTDYQLEMNIDTQSLISAGKMRSDCGDVRFTDIAPSRPYTDTAPGNILPYWIEFGCNTHITKFWVKVPSIPAGPSTIYMSYGDFRATSGSSGPDTFVFWEDFTGTTLNTAKWTQSGSASEVSINDKLFLNSGTNRGIFSIVDGTDGGNDANTDFDRANSPVLEFDYQPISMSTTLVGWKDTTATLGGTSTAVGSGGFIHAMNVNGTSSNDLYDPTPTSANSDNSQFWTTFAIPSYKVRVIMRSAADGNGAIYQRSADNGLTWVNYKTTTARTDATARIAFSTNFSSGSVDNVRVRKYASTPPTTTFGDESPTLGVQFAAGAGPVQAMVHSVTPTTIIASAPVHTATVTPTDVIITNADNQTATLVGVYEFFSPSITLLDPDNDIPDGGATVNITGTNFNPSGYKRAINITNGGGALTDYQIPVTVDTATLIAQGKMRGDGGDMRFYADEALTTPLPYFLEGPINSGTTKIWVKAANVPSGNSTVYMTYGDPSLTSQSSAPNTFIREIDGLSNKGSWNMDEASGTAAVADSSGFDNNGTSNNTTNVVTGKFGNARSFNSTSDTVITAGNSSSLDNINHGISVEGWFNLNVLPGSFNRIVSKGCTSSSSGWEMLFSSGKPRFYVRDGNSGEKSFGVLAGTAAPTVGTWHHFVGTFNPDTITAAFYYDGVVQDSVTSLGSVATSINNTAVTIGKCGSNNSMNGIIDEIKVYNRALTSAEVTDIYNNYGYTTPNYPGRVLVKKIPAGSDPEPAAVAGTESGMIDVYFDNASFPASVLNAARELVTVIVPDHNPPGAATVPVVVTNAGDSATSQRDFIYGVPPQITPPLSPDDGSINGGETVIINGSDFSNTPDPFHPGQELSVTFGGVPVGSANITLISSSQLEVITPVSTVTGLVDVVVTNPNTQSYTLQDGFTYTTIPDPANSTVTADPTSAEGDGVDTSTITVQLLDNSTPTPLAAPNRTVELAEILQSAGTSFIDAVNCTTGVSLGNVPPYQGVSGPDGKVCFKVRTEPSATPSTTLGNYEFRATDITGAAIVITQTATVNFTGLITHKGNSTFTGPAGGPFTADGTATGPLTATIKNKNNVAIEAKNVSVSQTSGPAGGSATITSIINPTGADGVATFSVSTTVAGTYTFRATETTSEPDVVLDESPDQVTMDFVAGPVDPAPAHSTLVTDTGTLLGNGIAMATLTATMRDTFDNPVIDKTVVFAQTAGPGTATITPVNCALPEPPGSSTNKTNTNGKACATVTALEAGTYTFNVTETDSNPDITINQTVDVTFTGPSSLNSTLTANPATVAANGTSSSTAIATLLDAAANPFPGRSVTLEKVSGNGTPVIDAVNCATNVSLGTGATSVTDSQGRACYQITSVNRTTYVFRANNTTEGFIVDQTATVEYVDGQVWTYSDGQVIANAADDDSTYYSPTETKVIRTTDGNYITSWQDTRNGFNGTVFAQKYNTSGVPQWTPSTGLLVAANTGNDISNVYILNDNAGGAIVIWSELNSTSSRYELRGQRINGAGTFLWTNPYKVVYDGVGNGLYNAIEDGSGGFFLSFKDSNLANQQESVTRINSSGNQVSGDIATWPVRLGSGPQCSGGSRNPMSLVRAGVVRVAWQEPSGGCAFLGTTYSVRIQTLNTLDNNDLLASSTVSTSNATAPADLPLYQCSFTPFLQDPRRMVEDGNGGIYILWHEDCLVSTSSTLDDEMLYINHIGRSGSGLNQWSYQLTAIGTVGTFAHVVGDMISDGVDGAILGFRNVREDNLGGPLPIGGVYMHRIRSTGSGGSTSPQNLWNGGNRVEISLEGSDFEMIPGPAVGTATIVYDVFNTTDQMDESFGKQFDAAGNPTWNANGVQVASDIIPYGFETEYSASKQLRQLAHDGAGNFVYVGNGENHGFINAPYAFDEDNFIQSVNSSGIVQWNSGNDIEISPGVDVQNTIEKAQQYHQMVPTSNGDFLVAWEDEADQPYFGNTLNPFPIGPTYSRRTFNGQFTPVADKIGADGISKWNSTFQGRGVAGIFDDTASTLNHTELKIAADQTANSPNGGLLLTWNDYLNTGTNAIKIQKLDQNGKRNQTWNISENGVSLASGAVLHTPDITSDGNGGGFATWTEDGSGSGTGLFITRFESSNGAINGTWSIKNPALGSTNFVRQNPKLLYHAGTGWVYDVFETRCTPSNVLSFTLLQYNATTGVLWGNKPTGPLTCPPLLPTHDFQDAIVDGNGNVFTAYRKADNNQIYVQKYSNASGIAYLWGSTGFQVSSSPNNNDNAVLASDNNGGVIVAWEQYNAGGTASDIAVQRLDSNGAKMWNDGIVISNNALAVLKQNPQIVKDGTNAPFPTNGAVITWSQENGTGRNIYAQRVVNGIRQWGTNGQQLSSLTTRTDTTPRIIGDNNGGGTTTWQGQSSPPDIFGQGLLESDHSYNSTFVRATADIIVADGVDAELVTATLLDQNDQPVAGRNITINVTNGNASGTTITPTACASGGSAGVTNSSGEACALITATVPGTYTYGASDTTDALNYVTITQTQNITFEAIPAPANCHFSGFEEEISAGGHHVVALRTNGSVWAWGSNGDSELAFGFNVAEPLPIQSNVTGSFTQVAAGGPFGFTAAIKDDGTLWAWGSDFYGQLGDGGTTFDVDPDPVPGMTNVTDVAAGLGHVIVRKGDGTIWAWGSNNAGQVGNGASGSNVTSPVQINGLSNVTDIAAGDYHSMALQSDGTVWVWGNNAWGQLGTGGGDSLTPTQVPGLSNITAIGIGRYHSFAVENDGTLWAWGYNADGELGDNTTQFKTTPVEITGITNVVQVKGGRYHSLVLKNDGTVWTMGLNDDGQLGDGTNIQRLVPTQVSGLTGVRAIAAGYQHSIASKADGTVWVWGLGTSGEIGNGAFNSSNVPVQIILDSCLSPNTGSILGGTNVTMTGANFQTTGTTTVTFDGVPATNVTVVNDTTITVTTPAHPLGTVDVVVTNPDLQTGTFPGAFTYIPPAPSVTNINPDTGPTAGGTNVTITGQYFEPVGTTTVTFDGVSATNVVVVNDTTITATTPAHAPGPVDVIVTNPDGQNDTLAGGFTYDNDFSNANSTVTASPGTLDVNSDSTVTVNLRNSLNAPIEAVTVTLAKSAGPGTPTITAVTCASGAVTPGTTNASGDACFNVDGHIEGTITVQATDVTDGNIILTDTADITFTVEVDAGLSTIVAVPPSVPNDDTTASRITVTLLNSASAPLADKVVTVQKTTGPANPTITAVLCSTGGSTPGTTNTVGEACFDVTSDLIGVDTFSATDVTDGNTTLTNTTNIEFTCAVEGGGTGGGTGGIQCAVIGITPQTGALTITEVPDSFSFPPAAAGDDSFSNGLGPDDADRVTVSDTRNSGGFTLQVQATTAFADTTNPLLTIPLTSLYTATSTIADGTRDVNGIACNGIQYLGPAYDLLPDCTGLPNPVTAQFNILGGFNTVGSFTGFTGNTLDGTVDLMQTGTNHNGSFSQFVNYYLAIPAGQQPGSYEVTLTFTAL